jgi:PhnB protein
MPHAARFLNNELNQEHTVRMNSYLFFSGQCEEAFKFYEKCLDGKIEVMMPHECSPAAFRVSADCLPEILHARMIIGDQVLMASDAPPGRQEKLQGFCINLGFKDPAEAERIFIMLSDSGTINMPFPKIFWFEGFGMLINRFGIPWMINCENAAEKAA